MHVHTFSFVVGARDLTIADIPLLGSGVDRVPQSVVRVVLEGHPRRRVPLGVFLTEALLGVRSEPELLTFTELHQQNVCMSLENR